MLCKTNNDITKPYFLSFFFLIQIVHYVQNSNKYDTEKTPHTSSTYDCRISVLGYVSINLSFLGLLTDLFRFDFSVSSVFHFCISMSVWAVANSPFYSDSNSVQYVFKESKEESNLLDVTKVVNS